MQRLALWSACSNLLCFCSLCSGTRLPGTFATWARPRGQQWVECVCWGEELTHPHPNSTLRCECFFFFCLCGWGNFFFSIISQIWGIPSLYVVNYEYKPNLKWEDTFKTSPHLKLILCILTLILLWCGYVHIMCAFKKNCICVTQLLSLFTFFYIRGYLCLKFSFKCKIDNLILLYTFIKHFIIF